MTNSNSDVGKLRTWLHYPASTRGSTGGAASQTESVTTVAAPSGTFEIAAVQTLFSLSPHAAKA
jgi:hypothetical protein